MNVEYVREFKRNYLVINDNKLLNDSYESKMIIRNDIEGLLSCKDRMINGEGYLYYDITSKHCFKTLNDNRMIDINDLKNLFGSIIRICNVMERYLIYEDGLVLSPEYIYQDIEGGEYYLLYYRNDNNEESIYELLDYLIENINNDDSEAIEAIYQMTDLIKRSHYALDEALRWFSDRYLINEKDKRDEIIEIDENVLDESKIIECGDIVKTNGQEIKKKSILDLIKSLFGKSVNKPVEINYDDILFDDSYQIESNNTRENNNTVFIPWIENCENKLYGINKGNKLRIDLNKTPAVIGKLKEKADIIITDESISRLHAKLYKSEGRYMIMDLNSTNGTFKNGLRLSPNEATAIEPGDEIGIGKLKFIYR